MAAPKVFISYSWDGDEHQAWVKNLADRLFDKGVDVVLDQYEVELGDDIILFMERGITNTDKVLLILTENYKTKADNRERGVGNECSMINAEWYNQRADNNKFIPIIRGKDTKKSTPVFVKMVTYLDMSDDALFEEKFKELYFRVYDEPILVKPNVGERPDFDELRGRTPQVPIVQPVTTSPPQPEKTMDKDEILKLIDVNIELALKELYKTLGNTNGTFNDLNDEYIDPPNNFSLSRFRSRLKSFVRIKI